MLFLTGSVVAQLPLYLLPYIHSPHSWPECGEFRVKGNSTVQILYWNLFNSFLLRLNRTQTPDYGLCVCESLSRVQLPGIPWTVAHPAPLSMESPGRNTGVGSHSLLQGIFLTQDQTRVSCTAGRPMRSWEILSLQTLTMSFHPLPVLVLRPAKATCICCSFSPESAFPSSAHI